MTTYYVGPGGDDGNDGLSYANRFLTLNAAEDVPVVPGDEIVAAPGTYTEIFNADVSGTSGNVITLTGDITGRRTSGAPGLVRITGSDDNETVTRNYGIVNNAIDYRTYQNLTVDGVAVYGISVTDSDEIIIQDCHVQETGGYGMRVRDPGVTTIRRCKIEACPSYPVVFDVSGANFDDNTSVIENCEFNAYNGGPGISKVGGLTIRNCLVNSGLYGVRVYGALTVGQTTTVENNLIRACSIGLRAVTAPATNEEITSDYNTLLNCATDYQNVSAGANDDPNLVLMHPPMLLEDYHIPIPVSLAPYSAQIAKAGGTFPSDDYFGQDRSATSGKNSWGPYQYGQRSRETTTVYDGSVSLALDDYGHVWEIIPVSGSTTVKVWAYKEADYTGDEPSMTIRQPGQADIEVEMTAAVETWEQLTYNWTPDASCPFIFLYLRSKNTQTAGDYRVFFDKREVV